MKIKGKSISDICELKDFLKKKQLERAERFLCSENNLPVSHTQQTVRSAASTVGREPSRSQTKYSVGSSAAKGINNQCEQLPLARNTVLDGNGPIEDSDSSINL